MKALSWIGGSAAVALSLYVGLHGLDYLSPGFAGPEFVVANRVADPWLPVHAVSAAVALLIGPVQLVGAVRRRWPRLHRWMGRAYVAACLAGGFSGLLLAGGTTAGPVGMAGFAALGVLTLLTAAQAWRLALKRRFAEHREWMIRSYALIFAGATFRVWLGLAAAAQLEFTASYQAIAFLCWVPNLLAAELYLALSRPRRRLRSPDAAVSRDLPREAAGGGPVAERSEERLVEGASLRPGGTIGPL